MLLFCFTCTLSNGKFGRGNTLAHLLGFLTLEDLVGNFIRLDLRLYEYIQCPIKNHMLDP